MTPTPTPMPTPFSHRWAKRLECPIDDGGEYHNDRWTNRDLIPIPPERRTYKIWSFFSYWFVAGCCITSYSIGSSLLALGLSAQRAIGCIVAGALIVALLSVACGIPGDRHHIGYTVLNRMPWGMRGGYFPVVLRVFVGMWWFGIQAYWGGQAFAVMLGAMSPRFANMHSSIPLSANITTQNLIGMLLWYIFFIPMVLVPPERLQKLFIGSSLLFGGTLIGLLAWAVHTAGGGGPLFHTSTSTAHTDTNTNYSMMLGITSVLSSWGSGTFGQSDWVRYSQRQNAPLLAQLVAAPVMIVCCALVGIVVTSASSTLLPGDPIIWNPIALLSAIQEQYHSSPHARAAVFFGATGCACSQLMINVQTNSMSIGMDIAGLWPRYINIRRGAYLLAAIGIACNPWQLVSSAAIFITVVSGIGVFISPIAGIYLADYFVVRRMRVKIQDLYLGNKESIYWYAHGVHWRAVLAFVLAAWPFWPGFIMSLINPTSTSNWVKLFEVSFLVAISIGFFAYSLICLVSPPPHKDQGLTELDDSQVLNSIRGDASVPEKSPSSDSEGLRSGDSDSQETA